MSDNQITTLKQTLTSAAMREQFARALPSHLTPERFTRIAITALTRTPKLADCTQESLMRCLLDLSAFGLEPDGRRAHLIPYGNQCTLIIDWKGLAELAMRSGIIAKLHADVVCENDTFVYNMGEVVAHEVDWRKPRGAMYAAYARAMTKTGESFFAVLSKEEIDAIRKRSRAGTSGPWVSDYNEMAKKTAFRRLAKWLPLSPEFRDAQEREDEDTTERDVTPQATSSALFKSTPALAESTPVVDTQPVEENGTERTQTALDIVNTLIQDTGVTWLQAAGALMKNKVVSEEYETPEAAPDAVLAVAVGKWDQIVKSVKGGAK